MGEDREALVKDALREAFVAQVEEAAGVREPTDAERRFGLLGGPEEAAVATLAWRRVVTPGWRTLAGVQLTMAPSRAPLDGGWVGATVAVRHLLYGAGCGGPSATTRSATVSATPRASGWAMDSTAIASAACWVSPSRRWVCASSA